MQAHGLKLERLKHQQPKARVSKVLEMFATYPPPLLNPQPLNPKPERPRPLVALLIVCNGIMSHVARHPLLADSS